MRRIASIIVPAYNEETGLRRLLESFILDFPSGEIEVVVVCNGCTDGTADVARSFGDAVRVVEIASPSKSNALSLGNALTDVFPRIYVDADVVIDGSSLRRLLGRLAGGDVLVCGPVRHLSRDMVDPLVGMYYDFWESLASVKYGLFGRGVIAVSEEGYRRIESLPEAMADDLVITEAFGVNESAVVPGSVVTVYPARTLSALIDRRVRVRAGNAEAVGKGLARPTSGSSLVDILRVAAGNRSLAKSFPVFVIVSLIVLWRSRQARRGRIANDWARDETSR